MFQMYQDIDLHASPWSIQLSQNTANVTDLTVTFLATSHMIRGQRFASKVCLTAARC